VRSGCLNNGSGPTPPSGTSGGLTWQSYQNDVGQARQVGLDTLLAGGLVTLGEAPVAVPAAITAYVVDFLVNFFEDIFGGGSSPPIPRQLMHRRHPLYGQIIGILESLIPTEASPVSAVFAGLGAAPSNVPPLQRADYSGQIIQVQFWGYNYCGPGNNGGPTAPNTTDECCREHDSCYGSRGLSGWDVLRHLAGANPSPGQQRCDQQLCNCVGGLGSAPIGAYDEHMRIGIGNLFCY